MVIRCTVRQQCQALAISKLINTSIISFLSCSFPSRHHSAHGRNIDANGMCPVMYGSLLEVTLASHLVSKPPSSRKSHTLYIGGGGMGDGCGTAVDECCRRNKLAMSAVCSTFSVHATACYPNRPKIVPDKRKG